LSRFLLLPVISGGRLCAVQREEEDEEETPTVVKGKTQTNMTAAKVARENSYLKTAKLCFLVQNPAFLALRERERERAMFSCSFLALREREGLRTCTQFSALSNKKWP
jgi:hypothetical protein